MNDGLNNYLVYVPGRPEMTVSYISRERAARCATRYRDLGHDVIVEILTDAFDEGTYEDWNGEV